MRLSEASTTQDGLFLQRTEEWFSERLGKVTGSPVLKVYKRLKNGNYSSEREAYKMEKIAERLSGLPSSSFTSPAIKRGIEKEETARQAYMRATNAEVIEVGFIPHPTIGMAGVSPDGLVGDDGLIEIKCPNTSTAVEVLLTEQVDEKYHAQMMWAMACTGRAWCDYVVFDDRLPENLQLYVKRIERDDDLIKTVEREVREFIAEVDADIARLLDKYPV